MNIELKPIAESKVRQLGGDVCGVLVRTDGEVMAVSEHGRCTRLDVGVMGPVEPAYMSDREDFEQWYANNFNRRPTEDGYETDICWQAWQAARAQSGQGAEAVDGKGSLPWFVRVYNSGYEAGHHDTVEGGFTPIHYSDVDTYHEEQVLEILEDLGVQALSDAHPQPAENTGPTRQYFYKVNSCPAESAESDQCICWHNEGEGPLADGSAKHWRNAATQHRTMQDDEIDRLKAQLKETEEKGRVLMDMCRDLKARVAELLTACQAVQRDLLLRAEPDWDGSGQQVVNLSAGFWEELNRVIGKYDDTACKSFDALILRKQAEAVEAAVRELMPGRCGAPDDPSPEFNAACEMCADFSDYAQHLRQQADEAERAGGGHG